MSRRNVTEFPPFYRPATRQDKPAEIVLFADATKARTEEPEWARRKRQAAESRALRNQRIQEAARSRPPTEPEPA